MKLGILALCMALAAAACRNEPPIATEDKTSSTHLDHEDTLARQYTNPALAKVTPRGTARVTLSLWNTLARSPSSSQVFLVPLDGSETTFDFGQKVAVQTIVNNTVAQELIFAGISVTCSARPVLVGADRKLVMVEARFADRHVLQRESLPFPLSPGTIVDQTTVSGTWLLEKGTNRKLCSWRKASPGRPERTEWELSASIDWQDDSSVQVQTAEATSIDAKMTFLETGRSPRIETLSASFDSLRLKQHTGSGGSTEPPDSPSTPRGPVFSAARGWQIPIETTVNATRTINYYPAHTSLAVRSLPNAPESFELSFADEHPRVSPDITEPSSPLPYGASGTVLLDWKKILDLPVVLCRLMDNLQQSTESVILERFTASELKDQP